MTLTAYTLTVSCKAYIKKYYSAIYGNPVVLNHLTDFGDTILTKMSTTPLSQINKTILNQFDRDYNDTLKFQLPIDTFFRIDHELTRQQVYSINRYLENVFETDLHMLVAVAGVFGVEKKLAIERFVSRFDIQLEEDITYEALKQKEYRYRKSSTGKNLFLNQIASPFAVFKRA